MRILLKALLFNKITLLKPNFTSLQDTGHDWLDVGVIVSTFQVDPVMHTSVLYYKTLLKTLQNLFTLVRFKGPIS